MSNYWPNRGSINVIIRFQEMETAKMNHVQSAYLLMQEYNYSYQQLGELMKDW